MRAVDDDLQAWVRSQSANVNVSLPERMPGEPDASPEQMRELERLGTVSKPSALAGLGTWQAAYLIQRLREERRDLEARALSTAEQEQASRDARGAGWIVFAVLAAAAVIIFRACDA